MSSKPVIVVVGGGAGGLELVTRLGRSLGKKKKATIILVDRNRYHLWKPLYHEVATGLLDPGVDSINYQTHGALNGYQFCLGSMCALDRESRTIRLAALFGTDDQEVLPERSLAYDHVVLAVGSVSNDFGTPGVKDNCVFLDTVKAAESLHQKFLETFLQATQPASDFHKRSPGLRFVIVGGGATGVELSAELSNVIERLPTLGKAIDKELVEILLVEAGERILPNLPEKISKGALEALNLMGVKVLQGAPVASVDASGVHFADGQYLRAELMIWAAGVKCQDWMKELAGLETNRLNQLVTDAHLRTTRDSNVWVIGDAACCKDKEGFVPPRAQAAHQMASLVHQNLIAELKGKPLKDFRYVDYGSLVNLSRYTTVGNLMGGLTRGPVFVQGHIAKLVYVSLYRLHQKAVFGSFKTLILMLIDKLNHVVRPKVKMH